MVNLTDKEFNYLSIDSINKPRHEFSNTVVVSRIIEVVKKHNLCCPVLEHRYEWMKERVVILTEDELKS